MKYTIIINTKDNQELVFKHILNFLAEPGRITMFKEKWTPVENVTGIILHEESDMSRLSDDEKRYLTDQISMLKNENERLTKYAEELDSAHAQVDKWIEKAGDLQTELARLEARNAALQEYATHKPGCYESGDKCICGLDALLEWTANRSTAESKDIVSVPQQTAKRPVFAVGNVMAWTRYSNALESQIEAIRDFMALLYLGIREGRDEAFEALDDKTKHLINEVWFERLEEEE